MAAYVRAHDAGVGSCVCILLNNNPVQDDDIRVGFRTRTSISEHWASWSNCLPLLGLRASSARALSGTIGVRHTLVASVVRGDATPHVGAR